MYVKRLILNNFRNYSHLDVSFDPKRIYITGSNGIGKTTILEAIYYLTLGRSFRKAEDKNLIKKGTDEASIYLTFHSDKDDLDHSLSCVISSSKKVFAYDDEKVKSLSSIFGKLIAIYYEPSLVFFFKGEPELRRKMLDETCSQLSDKYLYAISRYKKLLKERNLALQQDYDSDVIMAYRNQLINLSYRIIQDRKQLISYLSKEANKNYHNLFKDSAEFNLKYKTSCPLDDDQESFIKNSIALFEANKTIENMKRTTIIGPHRDDLLGKLDDYDLSNYGSQGENRIASLSLRLSILSLMKQKLNVAPLLLLDDITSDLDEERCQNLLSNIDKNEQQVFITGTKIPVGFSNFEIYKSDGKALTKGA